MFIDDLNVLLGDFEDKDEYGEVILMLDNPPRTISSPVPYIMNVVLGNLTTDWGYKLPRELPEDRQPPPNSSLQIGANITPAHTMIDLHIDQGGDGSMQVFGKCRKICLFYPPTKHNLTLLRTSNELVNKKFYSVGSMLEGGVMYSLDSTAAIVMAACTIHTTLTLDGGVLFGANWLAKSGFQAMSKIVSYDLDSNFATCNWNYLLRLYYKQIEHSAHGSTRNQKAKIADIVLETIQRILDRIGEKTDKHREKLAITSAIVDLVAPHCT
jgi:hypothetical protein